ncbi:hypothetical protein [Acidovorax sp. sic0104]|uniref:hypothetical protein n=1 Tax=Acidovorax sp. sic0104 TaxID=2854784 RepID=UPI001C44C709|nr:hypothetical protein [Acidovorax sp. sic0104]MBV7542074.1 hypothetical protein [Acidovorax sp. sic0104]
MNEEQEIKLQGLLLKFDGLPIECDGMTRVVSMYLESEGIPHEIHIGRLSVTGIGTTPAHFWIAFPDGRICDLRARMWLQDSAAVPHGLFRPTEAQAYIQTAKMATMPYSETLFTILAWAPLEHFLQPTLAQQ